MIIGVLYTFLTGKKEREERNNIIPKEKPERIIPMLSSDLIELLDEMFPEKTPKLGTPLDEIWFNAGRRHLIDWLKVNLNIDEGNEE